MSKLKKQKVEEKEYEVEKILNKRLTDVGKLEYYLKWKNFPESENSWEPLKNLNCPTLVKAYEDSLRNKSSGNKRKLKSTKNAVSESFMKKKVVVKNEDAVNFASLPAEILLKIFGYLTLKDLGRLALLCRRFNECTKIPELWKKVSIRFPWNHETVNEVTTKFSRKLQPSVTHLSLELTYPWDDRLYFEEFCINIQKKCPHLKSLNLCSTKISVGIRSAVQICAHCFPNLDVLSFYNCLFSDIRVEGEYDGISKIKVLNLPRSHYRIGDFRNNFFSKMPYLKKLYLDLPNVSVSLLGDASLLSRLEVLSICRAEKANRQFEFLAKSALHMTELYLCHSNINDSGLCFNKSMFPQLKVICLQDTYITCNGIIILIDSCPSLQSVFVPRRKAKIYAKHRLMYNKNSKVNIVKGIDECHHYDFRLFAE